MNFIELHEYYYHNGGYLTKPLICDIDEISSIVEDTTNYYVDGTDINMKNGKTFLVKETVKEIIDEIEDATREEDDLK